MYGANKATTVAAMTTRRATSAMRSLDKIAKTSYLRGLALSESSTSFGSLENNLLFYSLPWNLILGSIAV